MRDWLPLLTASAFIACSASLSAAEPEAELFSPPVAWYETAPRTNVIQVVNQVRLLLKEDWQRKTITADKVLDRYRIASRLCPEDGRIPFAFGVFFWKLGDKAKARSAFEKSVVISPEFLAGQQAAAWANFELGEADRGLTYLEGLIASLLAEADEYPSETQRLQAAQWLGRALGYLEGPSLSRPQADRMAEILKKLGGLSPELHAAGKEGRQEALARARELNDLVKQPLEEQQAYFRRQLDKALEDLTACETRIAAYQQELRSKSAEISAANQIHRRDGASVRLLLKQASLHEQEAERLSRTSYGKVVEEKEPEYKKEKQKDGSYKKVFDGYKTVKRRAPETASETARRMEDIRRQRVYAQEKRNVVAGMKANFKSQRDAASDLTKEAARFRNSMASEWDELQAQSRDLKRHVDRLKSWQAQPRLFSDYVRTVDPYVPWDAEVLREELLDSFELIESEDSDDSEKMAEGAKPEKPLGEKPRAEKAADVPAPEAAPAKPAAAVVDADDPLADVYKNLKLQNLARDPGKGQAKKVVFTYEFVNASATELRVPARPDGRRWCGVLQCWVERLGDDPKIARLPIGSFFGTRYARGGTTIACGPSIPGRTSQTYDHTLDTTGFPPGNYRFSVEFKTVDSETVLQTNSVDFEVK